MCRIHIHILSTHSILLDIRTVINTIHIIHRMYNSTGGRARPVEGNRTWSNGRTGKKKIFLFVTYTIIQSITCIEMCSLHLTHPSAHTHLGSRRSGAQGAVGGSVPCSRVSPQPWTIPAVAEIQTHNLEQSNALSIRPRLPLWNSWTASVAMTGQTACSRMASVAMTGQTSSVQKRHCSGFKVRRGL